ncbi:SAM-dependent methyltransferase [Streptomyces sp. NPDC046759]|uniref:SAM-dependent methyltransferase n=1 Tax=Streptomyces sp. NPDC046759 TaxID=3155019 RepID=UPI0033E57BD8
MIAYVEEARRYDASRGGEPRARAAAQALERLLPQDTGTLLDLACGTGIVTRRLPRLRPRGVLVTTVDRNGAYFVPGSDVARVTARLRDQYRLRVPDGRSRMLGRAARNGMRPAHETVFPGTGQGRSPRRWREVITAGRIPWCRHAEPSRVAEVLDGLAALRAGHPRPDLLYRLVALRKEGTP